MQFWQISKPVLALQLQKLWFFFYVPVPYQILSSAVKFFSHPCLFCLHTHHTDFILPSKRPTTHTRFSDCAEDYTKTKHWCSMWPTSAILNSFAGLPQQIWQWLHSSHSLSCMVGDCSTVTTEEPLGELGNGEMYSSIHLCHFINTAVPAEPRLVLHEILVQPLKPAPGLHSGITLPLQMDLPLSAGMLANGFKCIYLRWA